MSSDLSYVGKRFASAEECRDFFEKTFETKCFKSKEKLSIKRNNILTNPITKGGPKYKFILCLEATKLNKPKCCTFCIHMRNIKTGRKHSDSVKDRCWEVNAMYYNPGHTLECKYKRHRMNVTESGDDTTNAISANNLESIQLQTDHSHSNSISSAYNSLHIETVDAAVSCNNVMQSHKRKQAQITDTSDLESQQYDPRFQHINYNNNSNNNNTDHYTNEETNEDELGF
jgi:hypothetical protein